VHNLWRKPCEKKCMDKKLNDKIRKMNVEWKWKWSSSSLSLSQTERGESRCPWLHMLSVPLQESVQLSNRRICHHFPKWTTTKQYSFVNYPWQEPLQPALHCPLVFLSWVVSTQTTHCHILRFLVPIPKVQRILTWTETRSINPNIHDEKRNREPSQPITFFRLMVQ